MYIICMYYSICMNQKGLERASPQKTQVVFLQAPRNEVRNTTIEHVYLGVFGLSPLCGCVVEVHYFKCQLCAQWTAASDKI